MSMLDGSVLDQRSGGIKSTTMETPKRPTAPVETTEQFEFASKSRPGDDDGEAIAYNTWLAAARRTLDSASRLAGEHPDSSTAQSRLVQAAVIAGDSVVAVAAAKRALEEIARDSRTKDLGAACVAVSALLSCGEFDAAERYFNKLPPHVTLAVPMASALIDRDRLDDAEALLVDFNSPNATGLRGYIRLRLGDPQGAIGHLRKALSVNPSDADTSLLLSKAFSAIGARRKALRYVRQASVAAPGRKDISLALIQAIAAYGDTDQALVEVKRIQSTGVIETADFLLVQAQLHLNKGNGSRAITILKRARSVATDDIVQQAEIGSNIANLQSANGELDRAAVLSVHRKSRVAAPYSLAVGEMLVEWLQEARDSREAKSVLVSLEGAGVADKRLHPIAARAAYLAGDFEECLRRVTFWNAEDPTSYFAAAVAAMIRGQLYEDWAGAAEILHKSFVATGKPASIANDYAYVLALAGRPAEALRVIEFAERDHYVPMATRGLALVALGDFSAGLKCYRDAAVRADATDVDSVGRALMTVHQAMAFKRLQLDAEALVELRAGALPPVSLPEDWRNWPSFLLLRESAALRGWDWPVVIE